MAVDIGIDLGTASVLVYVKGKGRQLDSLCLSSRKLSRWLPQTDIGKPYIVQCFHLPEGGDKGGTVIARGTPEEVADNPVSYKESPTSYNVSIFLLILGIFSKKCSASSTVIFSTS